MKSRNITLFDGHAYMVGSQTASHDIYITGFETVPSGDVNAKFGYFAGEGDQEITGDYLLVKNKNNTWDSLSHSNNARKNFFNATISTGGNARNPILSNNYGIDIGFIDLPNSNKSILTNGDEDITFKFGSTQDTYIIPYFVFAIESYSTRGIVVNDANGLSDGQVNNSALQPVEFPPLYANILDKNDKVIEAVLVNPIDHTFQLSGLGDGEYAVQLSGTQGLIGQEPVVSLDSDWMFTGESNSGGTPDGMVDGKVSFTINGGDVTGLILGINKIPMTFDIMVLSDGSIIDYYGENYYEASKEAFKSEDEDGNIKKLILTEMPTIVDSIKVDGLVYYSGNFPVDGIEVNTFNNGQPSALIELYLKYTDIEQFIRVPFYVIDEAGGISEYGAAYFYGYDILPVEFVSFDAYKMNRTNELRWETAQEHENYGFYIERSVDAKEFEDIGFVRGGNDLGAIYYFVDDIPLTVSYYRLRQEDHYGDISYSIVRRVDQDNLGQSVMLYPNPSRDRIYIQQGENFVKEVVLINSVGQVLREIEIENALDVIMLGDLPKGIYFLVVGEEHIKFIKQ